MTNREKRFFNIAREISLLSDFDGPRVGAIVVDGTRILSTAHNSYKTRPLQYQYNRYRDFQDYRIVIPKQHAEIGALSPLIGKDIDWTRVSVFVYRELKNGTKACSRPCAACSRLMKDLGIRQVYFIDEDGNFCKEKVL